MNPAVHHYQETLHGAIVPSAAEVRFGPVLWGKSANPKLDHRSGSAGWANPGPDPSERVRLGSVRVRTQYLL